MPKIGLAYTLVLNPLADNILEFPAKFNMSINQFVILENVSGLSTYINNSLVTNSLTLRTPIIVEANDLIRFELIRNNDEVSRFEFLGNTL